LIDVLVFYYINDHALFASFEDVNLKFSYVWNSVWNGTSLLCLEIDMISSIDHWILLQLACFSQRFLFFPNREILFSFLFYSRTSMLVKSWGSSKYTMNSNGANLITCLIESGLYCYGTSFTQWKVFLFRDEVMVVCRCST
jgi:hypothetical protein